MKNRPMRKYGKYTPSPEFIKQLKKKENMKYIILNKGEKILPGDEILFRNPDYKAVFEEKDLAV